MKITKPPVKMNPDHIIQEKINHPVCPFCEKAHRLSKSKIAIDPEQIFIQDKGIRTRCEYTYYSFTDQPERNAYIELICIVLTKLHLFRNHIARFKKIEYHCNNCGAEWVSDPYPLDLCDKINWNDTIK